MATKKTRVKVPEATKQDAVRRYEAGEDLASLAAELNFPKQAIGPWRAKYGKNARANGKSAPKAKPTRKDELIEQIKDLEVDLLVAKAELAEIIVDESTEGR